MRLNVASDQKYRPGRNDAVPTAGRVGVRRMYRYPVLSRRSAKPCFASSVTQLPEHICMLGLLHVPSDQGQGFGESSIGIFLHLLKERSRKQLKYTLDRIVHSLAMLVALSGN